MLGELEPEGSDPIAAPPEIGEEVGATKVSTKKSEQTEVLRQACTRHRQMKRKRVRILARHTGSPI